MTRGFPPAEYQTRTARAQALMAARGLDALVLTTAPDILYFTGFLTRFWESPTRPWFLVLPVQGAPVAVIPAIGAALMGQSWITDIRTWPSPDLRDDGVGLLVETLEELTPKGAQIAFPDGHESALRMPLRDYYSVFGLLGPSRAAAHEQGVMRALRMVKSQAEIDKIAATCAIAGRAFARVPEIARPGVPVSEVFRRFQMLCLEEGADWVSYLAGGAGPGGYGDVISPAPDRPLAPGDVLMLDTGAVCDGYFCDYDRNFSVGPPAPEVADAHAQLITATQAGLEAARPGATAAEVHAAMAGALATPLAGRLGHGLGLSLTEWPSLLPADDTVLVPGMVLTLEPGLALGHKIMVHEENIAITEAAPRPLSPFAAPEIVTL
jgi:Xaa-Pro aminopeptidase